MFMANTLNPRPTYEDATVGFHRTSRLNAIQIMKDGILSRASRGLEANCPAMKWGGRIEYTFASIHGVQKNRCYDHQDGVTLLIDLEAVRNAGITVSYDDWGHEDVRDIQIQGNIRPEWIYGLVSDEWVETHGFKCLTD